MNNFQCNPMKLYIQDIFRANQTEENRYVYEMFDVKFKNIMIHGVVTAVYNKMEKTINFELSDPTGSVQVYYDTRKRNNKVTDDTLKDLLRSFERKSRTQSGYSMSLSVHDNICTMSSMLNAIEKKCANLFPDVGSYISVVGDIFSDELKTTRMVCAYRCRTTSVERDIVWLEEIRYLYQNYYLKAREESSL